MKIREFVQGERIHNSFSIKQKWLKNNWISFLLSDSSGEIEGPYYKRDFEKVYGNFNENEVVEIDGTVSGNKIRIDQIKLCKKYDIADFLPTTSKDIEMMFSEIKEIISELGEKNLRSVLEGFFSDGNFIEKFKRCPASLKIHHAYVGGLLEHTLNVTNIVKYSTSLYNVDRDLAIAGAILHDIGKIKEYEVTTNIKESEEGFLFGHIILGKEMVEKEIDQVKNFPETLKNKILHIILSHHDKPEYGSPKQAEFEEAYIVHCADMLDSKVFQFQSAKIRASRDKFKTYDKRLGGVYLK
jgi:uncharacterized domain HDIG